MAIISVIIPTYKRARLLEQCLRSLFADDLAPVREIILVIHDDDADGLREALNWKDRSELVRLVFTKHASRSAARNAAITVSEGDWCYFIDDDVLVIPGTLRELASAIARHPEASAVGGPNRVPEGCGLFERCVDGVLSSRLGAWKMRARYTGLAGQAWVDERSLIACNLAIRTPALRRQLLFHTSFDYGEETYLLARLRAEGCRFLYDPKLWVYHHRRAGLGAFCQQAFRSGRGRARQTWLLPGSLSPEFLGPPALVALSAAAPWGGKGAAALLALYAAACAGQGLLAGWRQRSPAAAFLTAFLIPAGHLSFGVGFWLSPFSRPDGGWPARAAQWALRARRVPGLSILYRAYYRAALAALRLWLKLGRVEVIGIWLRRGLARNDWTPGVSDVDLAVELDDMTIDEEMAWLDRWHRGFHRLRRLFPILGEVQIGTSEDWKKYLMGGDIRSLEISREALPLVGRGPAAAEPEKRASEAWMTAKRSLDAWSEQLHAYVRLSQLYFNGGDDLRAAFNARKAALDIARYGRLLDGDGAAPDGLSLAWRAASRADEARRPRQESPAGEALDALGDPRGAQDIRAGIESAFLNASQGLDESARKLLGRLPRGEPPVAACAGGSPPPHPREQEEFEGLCARLDKATGGQVSCAVHDSVNYWLIRTKQGGASNGSRLAWRGLRSLRETEAALSQTVLPLPPDAFRLTLWAPYIEDPLRSLSISSALRTGGSGQALSVSSGASPLLQRHILSLWRLTPADAPAPPQPLAALLQRESLCHLLVNWRSLGSPASTGDDYQRWVYLYGRTLSLRLHARNGEAWPSFPLAPLAARFAEVFPEERDWIRSNVLDAPGIGNWSGHRAFFARQLREAAAGL